MILKYGILTLIQRAITLGIEVDDYQNFYEFLFKTAEQQWRKIVGENVPIILQRIYWYQIGSIDIWDLEDAQVQALLRDKFEQNRQLKAGYMSAAGKSLLGKSQEEVARKAWSLCFDEIKNWYESKQSVLNGIQRFHHSVRSSTDLIDILEIGHWKVDFFAKSCDEKGLDTRLAVDMVALEANYDVAIVVSGDADSIPSIDLMKGRGKHVGAVEFLRGYPPEQKGRGFSSKIKLSADFVCRIYEMELVSKGLARKSNSDGDMR